MIMSSLGGVSLPESDSFMQGDGADGSGSGMGPGDSEDDESVRGSGSGHGPIHGKYSCNFQISEAVHKV